IATAIVVAVILYGSLYPFKFHQPIDGIGPVRQLLQSWAEPPGRGDFLANTLLYLPLGFFLVLAVAGKARAVPAILIAVVFGALLSTSMELTQYYIPDRVTAAEDVYANVAGTALGAIVGSLAGFSSPWAFSREISLQRVPLLLLAVWLGYRLYPYVPTIDLHKYWEALKPIVLYPRLTAYDLFRYTATWLTLAALVEAVVGPKRAWLFIPLFIASVLIAKLLIIGKTLALAEVAGAGIGFGAWSLLAATGARFRLIVIALLFCAYVIAERLIPFQFAAHRRSFGWIPFLSFLYGSLEVNILSFLEKTFLYGSLIWLFSMIGLRMRTSTILVAVTLFASSWAETYLPNRSAEITDAVMALLIGAILATMQGGASRSGEN
ncbi:MAG: VanZ family protein, partial [Stellaceae bacterium]